MIEQMEASEYHKLCGLLIELNRVCDKYELKELKYCKKVFTIEKDRKIGLMV